MVTHDASEAVVTTLAPDDPTRAGTCAHAPAPPSTAPARTDCRLPTGAPEVRLTAARISVSIASNVIFINWL